MERECLKPNTKPKLQKFVPWSEHHTPTPEVERVCKGIFPLHVLIFSEK